MSRLASALLALFLGLQPMGSEAQEGSGPTDFGESIRVEIINVEVYVTDRDGVLMTGLEREDFELFIDGRPVAISNFYAVSGEGGESLRERALRPEGPTVDTALVPEDQRLHLVVYVDNYHLQPVTRNRALAHLRTFIRRSVQPGDRVMLVTHEHSVKVRQPFTSDPEEVTEALYGVERLTGFEIQFQSERQEVLDLIYGGSSLSQVWSRVRALAESRENAMRSTLEDLREYMGVLSGLPGRKMILYVSDGLPMRPAEDIYQALYDQYDDVSLLMEGLRGDMSRDFDELTRLANASRISFYTLEAAGLRSHGYTGAQSGSIAGGPKIDNMHFWNLRSPLIMLAAETGGTAIVGTNNMAPALESIGRDFSSYYSLGFVPPLADPSFHRIEVKLRQKIKGATVRHREGYRRKPRRAVMTEGVRAAVYFGHETNPLGVELTVGSGRPDEDEEFSVPVWIDIPIEQIGLIPRGETHQGRLRVFVSATDSDGRRADVSDIEVPIEIPSARLDEALKSDYRYELDLRMRGGRQVLGIGVDDEIGGAISFLARPIRVGS